MELRKHPKMIWQGGPTWPPTWDGPHGPDNPLPQGEVGVLTGVEIGSPELKPPHCILITRYNDQEYFGSLSFDDEEFFNQICDILNGHIGEPISAIGGLDIS
jgi:hypothetical protein